MAQAPPVGQPVVPVGPTSIPADGTFSCGRLDILNAEASSIANCGSGQRCAARTVISTCTGAGTQCCSRLISTCIGAMCFATHEISTCLSGSTCCAPRVTTCLGKCP